MWLGRTLWAGLWSWSCPRRCRWRQQASCCGSSHSERCWWRLWGPACGSCKRGYMGEMGLVRLGRYFMGKSPDEKNKDKTNLKLHYCCKNLSNTKIQVFCFHFFILRAKQKRQKSHFWTTGATGDRLCGFFILMKSWCAIKKKEATTEISV